MAAKEKIGVIVSAKRNNTCVVSVSERILHKKYKKVVTKTRRYYAHMGNENSTLGDKVKICQTRPISKTKKWVLVSTLKKSAT